MEEGDENDDWTDSDDSEDLENTLSRTRRMWPFANLKGKRKMSNDALSMGNMEADHRAGQGDDEEEEEERMWRSAIADNQHDISRLDEGEHQVQQGENSSTGKSFVVIRSQNPR